MFTNSINIKSSISVYLGLVLLGIHIAYIFLIYPFLRHPLRKIPRAHWSVAFPYVGSIWIKYRRYCKRNNATTLQAHRIHGDVVRLGYEELSINCVENGVRTVYGGGWEKSNYYARKYASYGAANMFTTMHGDPHSQKKRTIAHVYSKSYLHSSEQLKCNSSYLLTQRILPLLQSCSDSGKAVDVFDMNKAFTMDFSSAYLFGLSRSTNIIQDDEMRKELMHNYHLRHDGEWHKTEIPPWVHRWMRTLHISVIPRHVATANLWLEKWTTKMCESTEKYLNRSSSQQQADHPSNDPIVYRHFKKGIADLKIKDPETGRKFLHNILDSDLFLKGRNGLDLMSKNELYSELFDHLEAGHATSTTSLTYLFWELSRNALIQDRVRAELLQLTPQLIWPLPPSKSRQDFKLPDAKGIDSLPYLDAMVIETLRLHTPIPSHEPRVSPYINGGSVLGQFLGIPGGVIVSAMAHTLHRNEDVFPESEVFNPGRWLISDEEQLKKMKRWFWAFGSGGRMCIGSHFAVQEIKLFTAAIYSNWRTEIVNDEGIEKVDGHATKPRGNKLILRFVHR